MYYYYFYDLWKYFFEYLNVDIMVSPKTNKEIMGFGIKYSTDEMCLSMKNYIGHVAYLKEKCDYILIPRIDNYGIDNQTCTNFLASYDIINNLFNVNILNYNINLLNKEDELEGFINIGKRLNINKKKIIDAYNYAEVKSNRIRKEKIFKNLKNLKSSKKKILLVGHPYNIYDEYIGMPIINLIKSMNVEIIYSDLSDDIDKSSMFSKGLYWKYSKESLSGISKYINKTDGVIFLSSFPCGLDSLVNELVMRKINKPYINIIIDDNSIDGGIETRIESFIDIVNSTKN